LLRQRLEARIAEPALCDLLLSWVRGFVWDGHTTHPVHAGVPQGSPISPLLANFFLSDLDLALEESGLKFIRYADDFLILSRERTDAESGLEIARERLDPLHLQFKTGKTAIAGFDDGFRFLGAFFLGGDVWIPWGPHDPHRRVLAVPCPMPRRLIDKWREPPSLTAMGRALRDARHRPVPPPHTEAVMESDAMAYLYVTEQRSVLRKIGNRLVVEKDEEILLDSPYHKLEAVLLFGSIQITTQAMTELLDAGIPVSLLSREGALRGSLDPPQGKNVLLRIAQFEVHRDPEKSLALARRAVAAKLANSAAVLQSFGDRDRAHDGQTEAALAHIEAAREKIVAATAIDALDGIEGPAARLYFDVLMMRNKSVFAWPGRVRHPATDPINALLSFGYTLVTNELAALVEISGLDSYVGCLHQLDYGRRSLALDLVEPYRAPLVDRLVLTVLNRRQFGPDDFEKAEHGGVYLQSAAARRFLAEYERWMLHGPSKTQKGFRDELRETVQSYAAALRAADPGVYEPFRFGALPEGGDDGGD